MIIKTSPVEDVKPADLQPHPLADLFPMMDEDAFLDFAQDIEKNGQREPIILFGNKILDGRNRFKACQWLGISPKLKEYHGNDALGFVISLNLKRRHLTESQRGMIAASLSNLRDGQKKTTRSANLPTSDQTANWRNDEPKANLPEVSQPEAAKMLNVSERTVRTAKQVQRTGSPELVRAVEQGEISVSAAAVIAKEPIEVQQYVMTPSQEKELSTALKRLQNAKEIKEEADRFVPPAPLTDSQKAEQRRVFGTQETRGVVMDLLNAGKMVAKLPDPEVVAGFVPAGMGNIVTNNINAMREVSKWFDAFVKAWQAKE